MVNLKNYQSLDIIRSRKRENGVGLIEILIAVVIMSLGFLAAARMQVEGMRFSQSAYYQSQAHFMANDMIDRMRSNIPGVIADEYSGMTTASGIVKPDCSNVNAPCDPTTIAALDRFEWSANLFPLTNAAGFIPALYAPANGQITRIGDISEQRYSIVMNWTELVQGDNEDQSLAIQFQLETRQ
ncbi:MAG: type IV pilus assembly protein PilV [Granulosicoccus sp.]|jgi:type IV pilus assembly protein PilV